MGSDSAYQPSKRPLLGELERGRRDMEHPRLPARRGYWNFAVFFASTLEDTIKSPFTQPTCRRQIPNGHLPEGARVTDQHFGPPHQQGA